MKKTIKVGTRKSELALVQTNLIIDKIRKVKSDLDFVIIPYSTTGDEIIDKPLIDFGGKGVFVDVFETALLNKEIDLAVHSAKDMPMELPEGLGIIGIPEREDPRDVLITRKNEFQHDQKCVIGTCSLRRQFQIEQYYDAECKSLRGNVPTRLNKLRENQYDGIILAAAGLNRLGLQNDIDFDYRHFTIEEFIPAGGQGILAVEGRVDDDLVDIVKSINDPYTAICLETERLVLHHLNAGCHEAIGVFSYIQEGYIVVNAVYKKETEIQRVKEKAMIRDYKETALQVAKKLYSI